MKLFLVGVSCVGKTTIGEIVAEKLGINFFDLDEEIERYFNTSIERLQNKFSTTDQYRQEASMALAHLLKRSDSERCVVTLPPSGLEDAYLRVLKKTNGITLVVHDEPDNILKRIRFYDLDSKPIKKQLTVEEKEYYLNVIKEDIKWFGKSYRHAKLHVTIAYLDPDQAACKIIEAVNAFQRY